MTPSGIRSISCVISSRTHSSFSIVRENGVGGGCLGYGGKFGVDFDLCKSRGRREKVDLVFRSIFSIDEGKRKFQFDDVCGYRLWRSLYSWTILPSEEKAVSDSQVASSIGYPFHLM